MITLIDSTSNWILTHRIPLESHDDTSVGKSSPPLVHEPKAAEKNQTSPATKSTCMLLFSFEKLRHIPRWSSNLQIPRYPVNPRNSTEITSLKSVQKNITTTKHYFFVSHHYQNHHGGFGACLSCLDTLRDPAKKMAW